MSDWLQVRIPVPQDLVEAVETALTEAGAHSVSLLDAGDEALHEPDPGETPLWSETLVEGLFDDDADRNELARALEAAGLAELTGRLRFGRLDDRDWERAWMDRFEPMRFGRRLWLCPSHLEPEPDWERVIRLDPGLAFGSGTHPTTALCLAWIDAARLEGCDVLDYGCGSGVLAIAAGLCGARRLVAVDHDPQALLATADNAARNGLAGRIETLTPEGFDRLEGDRGRFDVVLANILAGPLVNLAPGLLDALRPGGHLVLSGILPEQAESVVRAYERLGTPVDSSERDDWVRLVFCRHGDGG